MPGSTHSSFRLWFALAIGLGSACILFFAVRPLSVAAPETEPFGETLMLWLVSPKMSPMSAWSLAVETQSANRHAQSAAIGERLAALEAREAIDGFEPLPESVGFIITATTELLSEIRRWPEVAYVTSAAQPTSLAVQQAVTFTLNLGMHSHLVSGSTPRPEPVALRLTREGALIAQSTAEPFPDGSGGYLYAATLLGSYSGAGGGGGSYCDPIIESGDVLQAIQSGRTFSLTVPLLTALGDPDTATVYGQAPPSATLEVYLYRYDDSDISYRQTITAADTGDYQVNFSGITPVAPRDYGYVFYTTQPESRVYARYNIPFLQVGIEDNYASGIVAPCTPINAELHDESGVLRDVGYGASSSNGVFTLYLDTVSRVGDTLVVTAAGQVMSLTLPALTAQPDPESNTIGGEGPAGASIQVNLYTGPLEYGGAYGPPLDDPEHSLTVTATPSGTLTGTYLVDFTSLTDVVAGNYGAVYATNAAGHRAYRRFAVSFLQVRLGDYLLTGQVNNTGPVTVTVWGNSGIPRDVHFVRAYNNGYFSDYGGRGELRLLVGDQVTVTAQDGKGTGTTVPQLTAQANLANSTVHGQTPPNSRLRVGLSPAHPHVSGGPSPPPSYRYTVWVTSTITGIYTADFSSLTTFKQGDTGAVFYVDSQAYEAYREYSVPAVPNIRVQSGSNYVTGMLPTDIENATVILRDAVGQVKATAGVWLRYGGSFEVYLYQDGQPAIIEANDTVEVATGATFATPTPTFTPTPSGVVDSAFEDTLISVTVPTLTVQADRATDALSGQAPPDVPLEITWRDEDLWSTGYRTWVVTSTMDGDYTLDLDGEVDLERGDELQTTYIDEYGNQIFVSRRIPRIEAELSVSEVSVLGPVYAPLTLTLLGADGTLLYTTTKTLDQYGSLTLYLGDHLNVLKADQVLIADLAGETLTLTLPYLTARADPEADTVSGEAPSQARLMVSPYDRYYRLDHWWPVTATVAGVYSVDFDGEVDIQSSTNGLVSYLHPDGHRVTLGYAVPHIALALGKSYVRGVSLESGVVTATLRDASGSVKGNGTDNSIGYDNQFYVNLTDAQGDAALVVGGDEVAVETAGSVMTFTVPVLTATFDRGSGILTGTAPTRAWIQVVLVGYSTRQIQVGADGTYAMDWSDRLPSPGTQGRLEYTDNQGNVTKLHFAVPYHDLYLPLISKGI